MVPLVLGGIGLFLLGMWMMTDGLKLAAGDALQEMLRSATSSPWRGLAVGVAITAIVQSSSAVTVATIGFVNAGLLNLTQSVWVIFGFVSTHGQIANLFHLHRKHLTATDHRQLRALAITAWREIAILIEA